MKTKHVLGLLSSAVLVAAIIATICFFVRQNRQWELSHAALDGDLGTVKRCVAAGASIDATPKSDGGANSGSPALVEAAWGGHDDVILFLLDHGASINRQDSSANTALNAAVIRGHFSTSQLLLSRGADPNVPGEGTPFWNATERHDTKLIELLKSHGATK